MAAARVSAVDLKPSVDTRDLKQAEETMELEKNNSVIAVIVGVILSLGLLGSGYFIGHGFYMSRMSDSYVTVKGLAEKDVSADLAIWSFKIAATGDDLTIVQGKIENDKGALISFLKERGISDEEISSGRISVIDLLSQQYRQERAESNRFIVNFSISVQSSDVAKINKASSQIGELVKKGLVLDDNAGPNYYFTGLNEIKPELIATATKNARRAAEQFAADSENRVGSIRRANQGIISIEARGGASRDADDMMGSDAQLKQIDKKVRVVSTVDYFLER